MISSDAPLRPAVRLHDHLHALLGAVSGGPGHRLEVVVELRRVVDAEGHHVLQAEERRVVDLLLEALDRLLERDVVAAAQGAHVRGEAARGQGALEAVEVLGGRVGRDERVGLRAGQQPRRRVARGLDGLQRLVEGPLRPRPVEAPDRPLHGRARGGQQRRRVGQQRRSRQERRALTDELPPRPLHVPSSERPAAWPAGGRPTGTAPWGPDRRPVRNRSGLRRRQYAGRLGSTSRAQARMPPRRFRRR